MDDLQNAILLASDPSSDPSLRSKALSDLSAFRSVTPPSSLLQLSLSLLSAPSADAVRPLSVLFWSLQSIHSVLPLLEPSSLFPPSTLLHSLLSLPLPPHPSLLNKLSQSISLLLSLLPLPSLPSAFSLLFPPSTSPHLFSRTLISLHDDFLSPDLPHHSSAASFKDCLRDNAIPPLIVHHLLDTLLAFRSSDPSLAALTLDAASRYVPWIDINLVANQAFLPSVFELVIATDTPEALRASAAGCFAAITAKRMDPRQKLALLQVTRLTALFSAGDDAVAKVPELVIVYATEALECYKKLREEEARELLDETLPSVLHLMEDADDSATLGIIVEFLSGYVSAYTTKSYFGQILQAVRLQMRYNSDVRASLDVLDKAGRDEEDLMTEHRKDLVSLFRSICHATPDMAQAFVKGLMTEALALPEASVEDVEVALTLFYRLGEEVGEEEIRAGRRLLGELIPMLLTARFGCHGHRAVALAFLETVTRFMKFVHENPLYVPHLLAVFLDVRGIHHPNLHVSRRASYLFMRSVKLLRNKLVPYLDKILESLHSALVEFTVPVSRSKELKLPASEDGSQTFESVGLLIGMEDVAADKQDECLASLLNPLCRQIEEIIMEEKALRLEESSPKTSMLLQIVMALTALSKGFNERLLSGRPSVAAMFKHTLEIVLRALMAFPYLKSLRGKIMSFLHRMVEILGTAIIPYLPDTLPKLLQDNEMKDTVEFFVLINQMMCKFGSAASGVLESIFPLIAEGLCTILSQESLISSISSSNEEIRELQDLQRITYTFLHVLTSHNLSSLLLSASSRPYLDRIMNSLMVASCCHRDVQLRKVCVQIFINLVKNWCANSGDADKIPGFRQFLVEKFATNCCLLSVLDKSFDFHDASTLILFGEIVTAQKVMYDTLGDFYMNYFVSKALASVHCPLQLAEQYYQGMKGSDTKAIRCFYQGLIENLRQQPNGSIVFR